MVHVAAQNLGSLDVVLDVDLLILRVGSIVRGPHGQEDDALLSGFLERQSDGNRSALPGEVGFDTVDLKYQWKKSFTKWVELSLAS